MITISSGNEVIKEKCRRNKADLAYPKVVSP
jgi:hypothetical protein